MDYDFSFARANLKVKLTLLIGICFVSLVIVTGFITTMREKATLENELRKRGLALASDLARFMARPMLSGDLPALRRFVNHSMEQEYVRYVVVLDPHGKVIMHNDLAEVGKLYNDPLSTTAISSRNPGYTGVHVSSSEELHCDMFAPIQVADIPLGTVRLGYSHLAIENEIADARRQIFIIGVLTTAVGGIFAYLLATYISSPIKKITDATHKVAAGQLDVETTIHRSDEIGALATAFNRMTHDLRTTTVSKDYFDNIITSMNDTLVVLDAHTKITDVNRKTCEMLEYSAHELIGRDIGMILSQGNQTLGMPDLDVVMLGSNVVNREVEYLTHHGRIIPMHFSAGVLKSKSGIVEGAVCIARDVTEMKLAEEAIRESERQIHYMYTQLLTAQEKERRRLSIELHDELGQSLMVLKLKLRSIRDGLEDEQEKLIRECDAMNAYIKDVAENVRRLSRDLSPSILEDVGLWAAIGWLAESFYEHNGIECSLDLTETGRLFSREVEINVYRMIQECLTNVAKHAQATSASLVIRRAANTVSFVLEDNGKGFDVRYARSKEPREKGLGLPSLFERARMLGASLDVWSQNGAGTKITFTVPVDNEDASL